MILLDHGQELGHDLITRNRAIACNKEMNVY